MDRGVMMREAFGVREACFRFAMKPVKLSDEPYLRSPRFKSTKNEMLPSHKIRAFSRVRLLICFAH